MDSQYSQPILDLARAAERVDRDYQLLRELAQIFLNECPPLLSTLKTAVEQRDAKQVQFTAHRLKSSVGNFCADSAFDAALALETAARADQVDGLESSLDDFVPKLDAVVRVLREFSAR